MSSESPSGKLSTPPGTTAPFPTRSTAASSAPSRFATDEDHETIRRESERIFLARIQGRAPKPNPAEELRRAEVDVREK